MSNKKRFSLVVDVHLILRKGNKILLLRRQNTGYEDGNYHLPAGHMDGDEPVTQALIRESKEEVGVDIEKENIRLVHIMHSKTNNERIGFFFEVRAWSGKITNMEPEKCSELKWFEMNSLPQQIVPYALFALTCYREHQLLSEYGWE